MSKENKRTILRIENPLAFGEGGDGGTGAAEGSANGVSAGVPSQQTTKGVKNSLADVVYGKQSVQTADAPDGAEGTVPDDRNAQFEALIKGEYKDLYDARVQDTIQKRLKSSKETVDKYNALAPTLEMLGRKYGVDTSDIEALNKAIEEDDSYYEDEALEKGITVDQLKQIRKMERENADLKRQMQEAKNQEQAERDVAMWMEQAKAAQQKFPSLNLGEELKNPNFVRVLKSGVDVETAYWALHHDELIPQAMQYTAKQVEQKIANKIASGSNRTAENGMSSSSPAQAKTDVTQLTKADRQEIARRVARGERIVF